MWKKKRQNEFQVLDVKDKVFMREDGMDYLISVILQTGFSNSS